MNNMPHRNLFLALLLSWLTTFAFANDDGEFLPVNEAFQVSAVDAGNHVHFTFTIADGYYLYKHRFGFEPTAGTPGELGEPVYQHASDFPEPIGVELHKDGIRALAVIPFMQGGRVIGALNLASHTHDVLTEKSRRTVQAIARSDLGEAITRAEAVQSLRESEEALKAESYRALNGFVMAAEDAGRKAKSFVEFLGPDNFF